MKRFLGFAAVVFTAFLLAVGVSAVTMYSSDGRTVEVEYDEVDDYEAVWWKREMKVYKPDGSSMAINPFEINKYEAEGWCREVTYYKTYIGELVANASSSSYYNAYETTDVYSIRDSIYARCIYNGGYSTKGSPFDEESYEKNGYYKGVTEYRSYSGENVLPPFNYYRADLPVAYKTCRAVTLYSPDGRILNVHPSNADNYRKVGWKDGIIAFKRVDYTPRDANDCGYFWTTKTVSPFCTQKQLEKLDEEGWVKGVYLFSASYPAQLLPPSETEVHIISGWKRGVAVYSADGSRTMIPSDEYEKYYNNGWRIAVYVFSIDETMTSVKELEVNPYFVEEYVAAGWLQAHPRTMYSIDGREIYVPQDKVEEFRSVGWYSDKSEVTVTMYADERTIEVFKGQIADYQAVGWSLEPVRIMYAEDGREIYVPESQIEAFEAVGWYTNKYELMVTVYSADGNTMEIFRGQIEAYKAVGWYPEITVYKVDSQYSSGYKSTTINPFDFEKYAKGGWYSEPVKKLYSIYGDSTVAPISQIAAYNAVGWYEYDEVYQKLYTLTDTVTVLKTESWKYTSQGYSATEPAFQIQKPNVGWGYNGYYRWPEFYVNGNRIYCRLPMLRNLTRGKVIERVDFQIKYFGSTGSRVKISTGKTYSNHSVYVYAPSIYDNFNYQSIPLGFGSSNIGGYIEEFTAPNYIHRVEIGNYKVYFNDGTSASVAGSVEIYNKKR